jgi:Reverse transcriptase (RNA-dependent DNA polymerase)
MFSLPHVANTPGGGLCTLISNDIAQQAAIWREQRDVDCLWVRIEGAGVGLDAPLFIGNCYIPCASSRALDATSLADRYATLAAATADAKALGYVILGGDMNAKVAHTVQLVHDEEHVASSGPNPVQDMNDSGKHMRGLCQSMGLQWLTGCVNGDLAGQPSFYHGNGMGGSSRIDHILVDTRLLPSVVSSRIRTDITGSDHFPVEGIFAWELPCQMELKDHGGKLRWNREGQAAYAKGVADLLPAMGAVCTGLSDQSSPEEVQGALHKVVEVLVQTAVHSGSKQSRGKQPTRQHAAWFDTECFKARRSLRRLSSRGGPGSTDLAQSKRKFRALCKKKKKLYAQGQVFQLMEDVKSNPRNFWKHFKSKAPQNSGDVAAAVSFWSSLLNKDIVPGLPQYLGSIADEPAHDLNGDITGEEVSGALAKLKSGTASGPDGVPPDLFKNADVWNEDGSSFVDNLACIFNLMFRNACVPADWGSALLTLVYKSGVRTDWGNYRPVAVMQAIAKVFASVLNNRLMAWAEANGIRANSQAGFRPKYSTSMQACVLNHLIEQHRHQREPLYVCFVDFKKAYDSVPRDQLWKRLYDKGVRGRMLFILQALYSNVTFSIKFQEGVSEEFNCNMGVRQGCPLSPFLFGVYIEKLDEQLRAELPMAGPVLGADTPSATRVPMLLYADDLGLIACSPTELQLLLDQLSIFSESAGMTVNLNKTKVVVFRNRKPKKENPSEAWVYQGVTIEVAESYKYLGITFYGVKQLMWTAKQQAVSANQAAGGMTMFYKKTLADKNVWLVLSLFKAVVMPSLMYGCEVWGTCLLSGGVHGDTDVLSRMRLAFFRSLLGVRNSTSSIAMLRELGEYPLLMLVVRQLVKFWNKVMSEMPRDSLISIALLSSQRRAASSPVQVTWFSQLHTFLSSIGCSEFVCDEEGAAVLFDLKRIMGVMRGTYHAQFRNLPNPQDAVSKDLKLATYHHWFAGSLPEDSEEWVISGYLRKCMKYKLVKKLSRFRLGSHDLRIELEKRKHESVKADLRSRFCLRCHSHVVDDEYHAVFECNTFAVQREQYPAIFQVYEGQEGMSEMFNDKSVSSSLARYLASISIC